MIENVGRHTNLFVEETFVGHSGGTLHWKIEMDALTNAEWKCIARMIMEHQKDFFQAAIGIPRGGLKLSGYLNEYCTHAPTDPYLLVDDVLTTGGSMEEFKKEHFKNKEVIGWVVFARRKPADWINALFQMPNHWADDPTKPEYNK
jgi:hypothetical protein